MRYYDDDDVESVECIATMCFMCILLLCVYHIILYFILFSNLLSFSRFSKEMKGNKLPSLNKINYMSKFTLVNQKVVCSILLVVWFCVYRPTLLTKKNTLCVFLLKFIYFLCGWK